MVEVLWYPLAIAGAAVGIVFARSLHELAHAVPILLDGGRVSVTVGSDDGPTVGLGPLTTTFGFDGLWKTLQFGYYEPRDDHSRFVRATSTLAGPLVTIAIVVVLGIALLSRGGDGPLVFVGRMVILGELMRAVYTTVPMTYSNGPYTGWESDGKRFLGIVRS